ncbi:hypothetical protein [Mucilaginibacter aquatilis]|uniref:DUF4377 domain-containing protein n=1 Tax=Mucilaginibacter aquatilis TaxID=1517760 RepID=A0A6I4IA62_9SPHI|nr:hypothetical protein [Mucilaginibacter aquatilis]MVN92031.1 hypothetical protein [Mucilaginibacter aquatilis]
MKLISSVLLLIFLLSTSSCSVKTEYDSMQDCYDDIELKSYQEIVKAWGAPDTESDIDITEGSLKQQQSGQMVNATVTCVWNRPKVKIKGINCVTLIFNAVELDGGVMVPGILKGYTDCNNSSVAYKEQSLDNSIESNKQVHHGSEIGSVSNPILRNVIDLPHPVEAVRNKSIKKYTVEGVSGREIYSWYAEKYGAVLESNSPSDHKYLYMPYNINDSCILLTMTGHLNGTIILEFSYQCDGNP